MKTLILVCTLAVMATGCASAQKKWTNDVIPGQSEDDVLNVMGTPDDVEKNNKDHDVYTWNLENYTQCSALFDGDRKLIRKHCETDYEALNRDNEARARAAAAYMQMRSMMPTYQQPVRSNYYNPYANTARPVQTNCTSNMMGGQIYSNCNSRPTGIDSSIYQQ